MGSDLSKQLSLKFRQLTISESSPPEMIDTRAVEEVKGNQQVINYN